LKALRELKQLKELKEQLGNICNIKMIAQRNHRLFIYKTQFPVHVNIYIRSLLYKINSNQQYFFQGVVTVATRGPLESTTKIVPGAVTFQNTEAMTKVR
jgi:hypothetical protein